MKTLIIVAMLAIWTDRIVETTGFLPGAKWMNADRR
jgi:hypothetical protein